MFAWCSQLLKFKKKKKKRKSAFLILKLYPETDSVESCLKESKCFFYLKARKEGEKEVRDGEGRDEREERRLGGETRGTRTKGPEGDAAGKTQPFPEPPVEQTVCDEGKGRDRDGPRRRSVAVRCP